jgi:hypothetical protein
MLVHQPNRWGEWIVGRWKFLGYRRFTDLSSAIGCSHDVIFRWRLMSTPPDAIRKGFDAELIIALRTDRWTLFNAYASIAPEAAPLIDSNGGRNTGGRSSIKRSPMRGAA